MEFPTSDELIRKWMFELHQVPFLAPDLAIPGGSLSSGEWVQDGVRSR